MQRRPREQQRIVEAPRLRVGDGDVLAGLRRCIEIARLLAVADRLAVVGDGLLYLPRISVDDGELVVACCQLVDCIEREHLQGFLVGLERGVQVLQQ